MPPALPTFTPYREDLEPWRGEGLVRLRVLAVPSPGRTGAVREALDAWMLSLTRDDQSPRAPEQAALQGGAVIERESAGAGERARQCERIVIFSGGQDGVESAGSTYQELRELLFRVDPQISGTLHEDRPATLEELEATRDVLDHHGEHHG